VSNRNDFQQAVIELQCLVLGYLDEKGKPDEGTLKAQGGAPFVRFLKGNSPTEKGAKGAPERDCQDGDENSPVQLSVEGLGYTEGQNLAEAVAKMKARISGSEAVAAGASKSSKSSR